jgi:hypothetical protein
VIAHAMKYVDMAEKVAEELDPDSVTRAQLKDIAHELTQREIALVRSYREFKDLLRQAAKQGNTRAARYVEETTWDLT